MALTISLTGDWMSNIGNRRRVVGTLNFGASYTTGGFNITPASVGLGVVDTLDIGAAGGYLPVYNYSNGNAQLYYDSAVANTVFNEVANAADTHTTTFTFEAVGR